MLNNVEFRDLPDTVTVDKVKMVACDGRGVSSVFHSCYISRYHLKTGMTVFGFISFNSINCIIIFFSLFML